MDFKKLTDEELMTKYQHGSHQAFTEIYERHSRKVYGYIVKKVRPIEQAEEVFQTVFIKIHNSKHLYHANYPLLPWVFTITHNTILDHLRSRASQAKSTQAYSQYVETLSSTNDSHSQSEVMSTSLNLEAASLSQNQKQALILRYHEDKTFEDIALALNTSPTNIRKLISRGIQKIRKLTAFGGSNEESK